MEHHLVVGLVVENGRLARFCETDKACLRILRSFEIIRVRIAAILVVHMLGERVHLVRAGLLERLRKDQHTVRLLIKDGQKIFLLLLCPLLRDKTLQLRPAIVMNGVEEDQVRTNAPINHKPSERFTNFVAVHVAILDGESHINRINRSDNC